MMTLSAHATAAELSLLARHPDAAVRAEVAGHPNTPASVLADLGAEFPAEVLANPALPLLRLAQPDLLNHWPTRTLERLTGEEEAPDWLLRLASRHAVIDVQLAAVVHPQLPADVLDKLADSPYWTIREYVARKPELPAPVLQKLVQDADYGVRITLAGRSDLPPDLREKLLHDEHPLVRAVVGFSGDK